MEGGGRGTKNEPGLRRLLFSPVQWKVWKSTLCTNALALSEP